MSERVAIIGAGSWGTALAIHLGRIGHEVRLWTRSVDQAREMQISRQNRDYLESAELPETVEPITDMALVGDAAAVLVAVPSVAMPEVAKAVSESGLSARVPVVSCSKGIEHASGRRMTEILAAHLPANPVAVLSGPSHAEEVALDKPTAVVVGAAEPEVARLLQETLAGGHFRVYGSHDVAGVELGGALKNIFAIAAGIGDGLGLGDNSKAALVTRSLAEMIRLGVALGGERETFQGLSGVGDLMVTCFSRHSRNRRLGELLGQGKGLEESIALLKQVAEGVPATRSAFELVSTHGLRAPLVEVVNRILFEGLSPSEALRALMERDLRHEND